MRPLLDAWRNGNNRTWNNWECNFENSGTKNLMQLDFGNVRKEGKEKSQNTLEYHPLKLESLYVLGRPTEFN